MMCVWSILFCPSHSSRVLIGVDLVGGNPTMNTPRLRRGERIASYSSFIFTCSGAPVIVYFVCDSASELEQWALLPFRGFHTLICFLFF